jgi:alpha-beta hydrolase superfamily lysophospholipase
VTLAADQLTVAPLPANARALVLLLHGGAEQGPQEIDGRSLAFRRARWMRGAISRRLGRAGVGTALLRFSVKGWNGRHGTPSPVVDAREALDRLRVEHAGLPFVLLGHSMGARTAVWVADDPSVVGVVGLAPWLPPDDPVAPLAGKQLVAAHGRRDRITSARATERYVRRAAAVTESARFVDMGPLGHYMLTGARRWNAAAVTETLGLLDRVSGITSST